MMNIDEVFTYHKACEGEKLHVGSPYGFSINMMLLFVNVGIVSQTLVFYVKYNTSRIVYKCRVNVREINRAGDIIFTMELIHYRIMSGVNNGR